MTQEMPNQFEDIDANERREKEKKALAREMFESKETFPFPGIIAEKYEKIKSDQELYPGYSTPIDELIERCKSEGVRVVLGEHLEQGDVFILPAQSDDIENDCLFPRQLQMDDVTSDDLRRLIMLDKKQG